MLFTKVYCFMIPVIVTMVENFVLYSRSLTSCSAAFQGTILDRSLKQKHLQGTDKSRCRQRSKTSLTEEKSQPGLGNKPDCVTIAPINSSIKVGTERSGGALAGNVILSNRVRGIIAYPFFPSPHFSQRSSRKAGKCCECGVTASKSPQTY